MANTTNITRADAFAAIEALISSGQAPTHISLRSGLGGRGSGPVLSRFIADWFAAYGMDIIPRVAAARAQHPTRQLAATLAASEQIKAAAEEAARVISDAEQARIRELDTRDAALTERELRLDERERAQAEWIADLQARLAQAEQQRETTATHADALAHQLTAARTAGDACTEALTHVREELEALRSAAEITSQGKAAAEARAAAVESERDRLLEQLANDRSALQDCDNVVGS